MTRSPLSNFSNALSRRDFLAATSATLAGIPLAVNAASAYPPARVGMLTAASLLPDPIGRDTLRALAHAALDAARTAGASYADVRVCDQPLLTTTVRAGTSAPQFSVTSWFGFGVRAIVDGATAFSYSRAPTFEAVTDAAKHAVASARGFGRALALPGEFTPAPVVTGEWETPMDIDPFTVPLREQWDVLGGYVDLVERVKYAHTSPVGFTLVWTDDTRVYASTEGSTITQRLHRVRFDLGFSGAQLNAVATSLGGRPRGSGGFELALDADVHPRLLRRAQAAVRLSSLPMTTADVGRYDVVLAGAATGAFIGQSILPALELDRAIGHEAGASGTSYLTPPLDVLGRQTFSPLVTITSDRDVPVKEHAHWDDEGVVCAPVTVVDRGRVVDYFSSRATAAALRPWYEQQGTAVRANGNYVTEFGFWNPSPRAGHAVVRPAEHDVSLDELCRGVKNGLLIYDCALNLDQQLSSFFGLPVAFKIVNGVVTAQVRNIGLQGGIKRLWSRSLVALGGASSVEHASVYTSKSQPTQFSESTVTAPAAHFTDVDVVRIGGDA